MDETNNHRTPDRNLGIEMVRVTEAAALAAGRWIGRGDKVGADQAAVDAMRLMLSTVPMSGVVVIGEGEKDEAPMLYNGEHVGDGTAPDVDIAVDPLDGTRLTSRGMGNALAVVAVSPRGTMYDPGPCVYMEKIACGPEAKDAIDLDAPPAENVRRVAKAKGVRPEDVTVTILDRDRHNDIVASVREAGARIFFITDGDVAGAINAAMEGTGIDLLIGIGGTPEGVTAACAVKCLGGEILGRMWPRDDEERAKAEQMGCDVKQILTVDDLVKGDNVFFCATGVTDGRLLRGVRYRPGKAYTHSIVMRSRSGTIRHIEAEHALEKLMLFSAVEYRS